MAPAEEFGGLGVPEVGNDPESDSMHDQEGSGFKNTYEFYQVVERIVKYPDGIDGGRASGNETVSFRAYGLDPEEQQYSLRFFSVLDPNRVMKTSVLFQPNSTRYIEFITPHWGGSYPYGNTTVELLSSDVPVSSVTFSHTASGTDTIYFRWNQEWTKTDLATGPASGGTTIIVSGHGFDFDNDRPHMKYICRFDDPDAASG